MNLQPDRDSVLFHTKSVWNGNSTLHRCSGTTGTAGNSRNSRGIPPGRLVPQRGNSSPNMRPFSNLEKLHPVPEPGNSSKRAGKVLSSFRPSPPIDGLTAGPQKALRSSKTGDRRLAKARGRQGTGKGGI